MSIEAVSDIQKASVSAFTVGGGGSGNAVQATVDFGSPGSEITFARITISASWVTTTTKLICGVDCTASTADHDPDDAIIEGVVAYPQNIVNGVGFDIVAYAPNGTWGRYLVNAIGV